MYKKYYKFKKKINLITYILKKKIFIGDMGCSSYTDDLSLFINGEISFEEIKDFFHWDTQTKEGIIFALKSEIFFMKMKISY